MQKQAKYLIDNHTAAAYESSWDYDNRYESDFDNPFPKSLVNHAVGGEISMKRDFQVQTCGKMVLEMFYRLETGTDGMFVKICGTDTKELFEYHTKAGKFVFNGVETDEEVVLGYNRVKVVFSLDEKNAKFVVNGKTVGVYNLYDFTDASTLVLGTTGETDITFVPTITELYIDYIANETFLGTNKYFPDEWKISGNYEICEHFPTNFAYLRPFTYAKTALKAGEYSSAALSINKTEGNVIFEGYVLLPDGADGARFSVKCNGEDAFAVYTENCEFKAMTGEFLRKFTPNVWQLIRFETDGENILVKINGKKCGTFKSKSDSFDEIAISFAPNVDATLCFADVVCESLIDYPDYCPKPQPVRHPEYEIGMNMCSMWREGYHIGWSPIAHFKDNTPLIGPYDEGLPEVADWEIKFMVEHGLTFQHYCWYNPDSLCNAPIKRSYMDHALRDGLLNARYSDMMKFSIMWENSTYNNPNTDDFKEYIWKHWCDHFFTDDRYLVIENKPLVTIWSPNFLQYWGKEKAKEVFAFMNEDIKRYGFDGMWFMSATWMVDYQNLSEYFDVLYAYHYHEGGCSPTIQKQRIDRCIRNHEENGMATFMKSISSGYNTAAWHGAEERCPTISLENYEKVLEHAKNHADNCDGKSLFDKFFMISTWNEYGEGTYVMPAHIHGFGYLDKIRKVFVPESGQCENLLPDENQSKRLTYLNVSGRRLVRRHGFEQSEEFVFADKDLYRRWDFRNGAKYDNAQSFEETKLQYNSDSVSVIIPEKDYEHYSLLLTDKNGLCQSTDATHVRIRIRTKEFALIRVAFLTDSSQVWFPDKVDINKSVVANEEYYELLYHLGRFPTWKGSITDIRIDNMVKTEFEIEQIDLLRYNPDELDVPNVFVNSRKPKLDFVPIDKNGHIIVSFDQRRSTFRALKLYHEYNGDSEELIVASASDRIIYKLGSNTVVKNGVEQAVSIPLTMRDGLLTLAIDELCALMNIKYSVDGNNIYIEV